MSTTVYTSAAFMIATCRELQINDSPHDSYKSERHVSLNVESENRIWHPAMQLRSRRHSFEFSAF